MVTLPPCLPALQVKFLFLVFPQHFLIKETLLQLELQVSARGGEEGKGVLVRPLVRLFINRVSLWWNAWIGTLINREPSRSHRWLPFPVRERERDAAQPVLTERWACVGGWRIDERGERDRVTLRALNSLSSTLQNYPTDAQSSEELVKATGSESPLQLLSWLISHQWALVKSSAHAYVKR